jgi:hypothetical protein
MSRGTMVAMWWTAVVGLALLSGCKSGGNGRAGATVACAAGSRVEIACGSGCGLGTCDGDPVLRICDGSVSVSSCASSSSTTIGTNDDMCGSLCPGLTVTCPSTGAITVAPVPFGTRSFRCNWETRVTSGAPGAPLLSESPDAG